MLTLRQRRNLLAALRAWSLEHGRQLPWRGVGDPYRVWLSEVMLQQTTVAAVVPYFERFLARFPTLADLALADESEVLRLWEGLGYYSRARNLHAAAQKIVANHNGEFPRVLGELNALPGIGRYTAGAIASFAFNLPAPIVEANTQRLYARLLGETRDVKSSAAQRSLWELATALVTTKLREDGFGPADINQSLMDLGAKVCIPVSPRCPECPVARWCAARTSGQETEIPRLPGRPAISKLDDVTVGILHEGRYLLRERPRGERWAGLWDFPRFTIPETSTLVATATEGVLAQTGLEIELGEEIAEFQHAVTRYQIRLRCFLGVIRSGQPFSSPQLKWIAPQDFDAVALSVTGRKFAQVLQAKHAGTSAQMTE